ncbi:MAG: sulfate adenylyltransferase, partial [bacterium]|nr:sulfate adenylyltransferase [bacterium]
MTKLVAPHGGKLIPRLLMGEELAAEIARAKSIPVVKMSSRETSDLIMMAQGAFSPLDGFMRKADYTTVVNEMHLANGLVWPIPITLSVSEDEAGKIKEGDEIALEDGQTGELMGNMLVEEKYRYDKKKEAIQVFRTDDEAHPGVAKVYNQGDVLLGGPIKAFSEGSYPVEFAEHYARPAET